MTTLTRLALPLLLGVLAACGGNSGVGPVTVSPKSVTVRAGDSTTFTATVQGAPEARVLWSVEGGEDAGTITASGVYTAPARAGAYTVVATHAADASKTDRAQVNVTEALTVTLSPTNPTVASGSTLAFTATVTGASDTSVTWSVEGAGTITASGLYTAPAQPGTSTVVATSVADPSKRGTTSVTVTGADDVRVSLTPSTQTLEQGASATFSATVTGTANTAVTWSVEGTDNGTISSTGVYTAPRKVGVFVVVATSVADPRRSASAQVTVPAATGAAYQDPPATGWRLVRNASASSGTTLVLDLLGPAGESGRGVDLTLTVEPSRASWVKVSASDAEPVVNRRFALGGAPQLLKGTIQGGTLKVGVYQKGTSAPATAYTGALLSVALKLEPSGSTPAGTVIPLSVVKAHALPATGTLASIRVAVGTLTAR